MERHSCKSRNPVKLSPVGLDARFRGHDKKNTATAHLAYRDSHMMSIKSIANNRGIRAIFTIQRTVAQEDLGNSPFRFKF